MNLLKFRGLKGGKLYLDPKEGYVYEYHKKRDTYLCVGTRFLKRTADSPNKGFSCSAMVGRPHNHPIPSRECVEVAALRWACILRVLRYRETETVSQSVQNVLSSQLRFESLARFITPKVQQALKNYHQQAKENHPDAHAFLKHFDEQSFSSFCDAIFTLPYWNQPVHFTIKDEPTTTTHLKQQIPAELWEIIRKLQAIRQDSYPELYQQCFLKFEEIIIEYGQAWKELGEIGSNNKTDFNRATSVAKRIFNPSRLERWLKLKQYENEMDRMINDAKKTVEIIEKIQLKKQLARTSQGKYTLILRIPPMDYWTKRTLMQMERFSKIFSGDEMFDTDDVVSDCEESQDVPWYMVEEKRKKVLDEIRQLVNHVKRNQHSPCRAQYFIIVDQNDTKFGCRYIVYKNGKLLRDNIRRLPDPPTKLHVYLWTFNESQETIVRLSWKYEDVNFFDCFLIEYRNAGTTIWKQARTNKLVGLSQTRMSFKYQRGLAMEFRVAAETYVGFSEFSKIVDTCHLERHLSNESKEVVLPSFYKKQENLKFNNQLKRVADESVKIEHVMRKIPKVDIEIILLD